MTTLAQAMGLHTLPAGQQPTEPDPRIARAQAFLDDLTLLTLKHGVAIFKPPHKVEPTLADETAIIAESLRVHQHGRYSVEVCPGPMYDSFHTTTVISELPTGHPAKDVDGYARTSQKKSTVPTMDGGPPQQEAPDGATEFLKTCIENTPEGYER